ncbi:hypothetical protein N7453_002361 [Penicillium expansum]|nr:hypothetical protein N7453_002361 [Penicillium expansum]
MMNNTDPYYKLGSAVLGIWRSGNILETPLQRLVAINEGEERHQMTERQLCAQATGCSERGEPRCACHSVARKCHGNSDEPAR